jgi:hypothetical protein
MVSHLYPHSYGSGMGHAGHQPGMACLAAGFAHVEDCIVNNCFHVTARSTWHYQV